MSILPDDQNDPLRFNQTAWDEMARVGDRYYKSMSAEQIAAARSGQWKIRVTPQKPVPMDWMLPVVGKKVLCLAGAGGQQAPLMAAAGAIVTVFDLSTEQLQRDMQVAERESLEIETVAGDMADLSCFESGQFDLIINPCSVCFVSSVGEIWSECYRVLRSGGQLITGFINPLYYLFDALEMDKNRFVVRHKIPYSDFDLPVEERERLLGDARPREFGHSLEDLIGLQLKAGFAITGFFEDGWGQNDKLSSMINLFCATRAVK